jgi:hypothetical protein
MTRHMLPCLICGQHNHSSSSCNSQLAAGLQAGDLPAEPATTCHLGASKYRQGYLDNPPNPHLRRPKEGNGRDYRAEEYRGYECWQFRFAP